MNKYKQINELNNINFIKTKYLQFYSLSFYKKLITLWYACTSVSGYLM